MISKIEEAGAEIRESGVLTKWFEGCDEKVKKVTGLSTGFYFPMYFRKGGMPIWSVPRFSARVSLRFGERGGRCAVYLRRRGDV